MGGGTAAAADRGGPPVHAASHLSFGLAASDGGPPRPGSGLGQNPPTGLVVDYYLRDKPAPGQAPLAIEILDRDGKLIRRFTAAKL